MSTQEGEPIVGAADDARGDGLESDGADYEFSLDNGSDREEPVGENPLKVESAADRDHGDTSRSQERGSDANSSGVDKPKGNAPRILPVETFICCKRCLKGVDGRVATCPCSIPTISRKKALGTLVVFVGHLVTDLLDRAEWMWSLSLQRLSP